jgi:ubiquinone/menaquinone biosynthesis C-methylase UbiE
MADMRDGARELLGTVSGGRVIDVATGAGDFIATLVDGLGSWDEIVGIDSDPALGDPFDEAFGATPGIRFETMDAMRPDYSPGSFDTASVSNSLHHFANARTVLNRMLELLRDGGALIVSEMYRDRQSPTQATHVALHHWCAQVDRTQGIVHRPTYTRRQLMSLIERFGLDEVRTTDLEHTTSDPKDAATIEAVDGAIERYLAKAGGHPDLVRTGEEVRDRLHAVGIHGATTLLVVGRRRPS